MSKYKTFNIIDTVSVNPQANTVIHRKESCISFYRLSFNKGTGELTQTTFIWDNNVKVIIDTAFNIRIDGSYLTDQWNIFESTQTNPLRSKLIQYSVESNRLRQMGDTIESTKQLQKSNFLIKDFNKSLDSLIFLGEATFVNFYLLIGRWESWPKSVVNQQLKRFSNTWAKHPFMEDIINEISLIESVSEGVQIKPFKRKTIESKVLDLSMVKSEYILLDFWGSWCGPCIKAIPELQALYNSFDESRLKIIGIAGENRLPSKAMRDIITKKNIRWEQIEELRQGKETLSQVLNVTFYPTYFLLDRKLNIIKRGDSRILPEVEKILAGK